MPENGKNTDQITPSVVEDQVRAHDRAMRDGRKMWAMYKSTYMTKYWEYMAGERLPRNPRATEIEIEVNRLWGVLSSYLGALYPRASRAVLSQDPAGQGDAEKAELAINRWLSSSKIHQRVMTALRQGLLYPGSGVKVGYHSGRGSPLDRVWMRVVPWWEMLLDRDVGDVDDERFRGHVYYRPKVEVEREYGLEELAGTRRLDFLSNATIASDDEPKGRRDEKTALSDESAFVRVLELCNLVDTYRDPENPEIEYQGRLEIYVLGQGGISKEPVWVGPLPFAEPDGQPAPHVIPLIFNHEPEFPLRGIAHTARLMPQFRELNSYRSFLAMSTRKDTRQYVTRKGTFSAEEMTNLTEGHDGLVLEVESGFERPLGDAIIPIQNAPISPNIWNYVGNVENDLERVIGTSPQARGMITKATAFEVQTAMQYTESEFGMHGNIKDQWLGGLVSLVLRALIACMQDTGDSAGAYEEQDVELAEVGAQPSGDAESEETETEAEAEEWTVERIKELAKKAGEDVDGDEFSRLAEKATGKNSLDDMRPDELARLGAMLTGSAVDKEAATSEEDEAQAEEALVKGISAEQEPYVDEDSVRDLGTTQVGDVTAVQQEVLVLMERGDKIIVTAQDLDAKFEVSFIEGGRTPLTDAAMQQNLVALMEPYSALWQQSQDKGPAGVFARSYMKVIAERFDFPKDLHPEEMEAAAKAAEEEQKAQKKEQPEQPPQQAGPPQMMPGAPPQGAPPQGAPPQGPPPGGENQEMAQIMAEVGQLPPEQALVALKQLFENDANMMQILSEVEALPPQQQQQMIGQIIGAAGAPV